VVLIDEIDKAPRDFPNDLLHELSQMSFRVIETQEEIPSDRKVQPILFITSNSERRLPEPFLRRCVYHHIEFDDAIVHKAVKRRQEHYKALGDGLLELAIRRFLAVRDRNLRKLPATGELLVWLRILALALEGEQRAEIASRLKDDSLGKLPFLGVLLKDHKDLLEIGGQ